MRLAPPVNWLWEGYLGRGNITLLTSYWKSGKTTLLAGLLHQMAAGGTLLGHSLPRGESFDCFSRSRRSNGRSGSARSPSAATRNCWPGRSAHRPTPQQWNRFVDYARARRAAGELDLFIVDSLRKFLPGSSESDPAHADGNARSRYRAWPRRA